MYRDAVTLLLIARTGRHTGIGSAYIYIANAGRLCAELRARGARVQGEPVASRGGCASFACWISKTTNSASASRSSELPRPFGSTME